MRFAIFQRQVGCQAKTEDLIQPERGVDVEIVRDKPGGDAVGGAGEAVDRLFAIGDGGVIAPEPGAIPEGDAGLIADFDRRIWGEEGREAFDDPVFGFVAGVRVEIEDIVILDAVISRSARQVVPDIAINRAGDEPWVRQVRLTQGVQRRHQVGVTADDCLQGGHLGVITSIGQRLADQKGLAHSEAGRAVIAGLCGFLDARKPERGERPVIFRQFNAAFQFQRGQSALFAGQITPQWAPQLDIVGVAAVSPSADVAGYADWARTTPLPDRFAHIARGQAWMLAAGFEAAYGDMNLDMLLSPQALAALPGLEEDPDACIGEWGEVAVTLPDNGLIAEFADVPPWSERFAQASPSVVTVAPVLMLTGTLDYLRPIIDPLQEPFCKAGTDLDFRVLDGLTHLNIAGESMPLVLEWLAERFEGIATHSPGCP